MPETVTCVGNAGTGFGTVERMTQAPGGDFSVKLVNDHNQGLELVWARGEAYVRSLYGPFHKRRTDRTSPERLRELVNECQAVPHPHGEVGLAGEPVC